jgi:hypothetical protein
MYRPGKDVTIEFKVRIHLPASVSKEEREWLEANLRERIADAAKSLWANLLPERRSN